MGKAIFGSEQVALIRTFHAIGVSQVEIARCYGTSQSVISGIVRNPGYGQRKVTHRSPVTPATRAKISQGVLAAWKEGTLRERCRQSRIRLRDQGICTKLSLDDVRDIRDRLARREKGTDIARHYNVSTAMISRIKQGSRWKDVQTG